MPQETAEVPQVKAALRVAFREQRRLLTEASRVNAHERLSPHLVEALEGLDPRLTVGVYAATGSELDLRPSLSALGDHPIAWPRVEGALLGFYWAREDELVPGFRSLREPPGSAGRCPPAQLGAVLVPGLGFSLTGARLGQGGGYYDRTLARAEWAHVRRIGVGYQAQLVAALPVEDHDIMMDYVVTETGAERVTLDPARGAW